MPSWASLREYKFHVGNLKAFEFSFGGQNSGEKPVEVGSFISLFIGFIHVQGFLPSTGVLQN